MTSRPSHENGSRRSTTAIGLVAFVALSLAALVLLQTDSSESRSSSAREVEQHAGSGDDSEGGLLQGQDISAPRAREPASVDGEDAVPSGPDDLTYDEMVAVDQFIRDIGNVINDDPARYLTHPLLNPDGVAAPPELVQQVADLIARAEEERDQVGDAAGDLAVALVMQRMDDGLENGDLWPEGANRTGTSVVSTSLTHRGRDYNYKIYVGDDPEFDALWNQRSESMQNANREIAQLVLLHL